jgi:hypothetical protein
MQAPILSASPQIERLSSIDAVKFREEYVKPQVPLIFGSGIANWNALRTWGPKFLRDQFPGLEVVDEHTQETNSLETFITSIEQGESRWGRLYLIDQYAHMIRDVSPSPPCLDNSWLQGRFIPSFYGLKRRIQQPSRPDLLIGGPASYFPMYHHEHNFCHCFLFQIYGDKQVVLFEPNAKESLYPYADHPNKSTLSPVDVPDPDSHPLFQRAKFVTGTLSPGDTLFSPSGWWLGIHNPTVSLTVRQHLVEASNWKLFCRGFIAQHKFHSNAFKAALDAMVLRLLKAAYTASPGR